MFPSEFSAIKINPTATNAFLFLKQNINRAKPMNNPITKVCRLAKFLTFSRRALRGLILAGGLGLAMQALHADEFEVVTVDNDLTVGGNATIGNSLTVDGGATFALGANIGSDVIAGGNMYANNTLGITDRLAIQAVLVTDGEQEFTNITFSGNSSTTWGWVEEGGAVGPQMTLDPNGVLTVYGGESGIILDPGNQTIYGGSGTFYTFSSGNLTQIYVDGEGVLELYGNTSNLTVNPDTQEFYFDGNLGFGQTNGTFVMSSNTSNPTSANISFDPGNQEIVFGNELVIDGNSSHTTIFPGVTQFAIGNSTASGVQSVALGGASTASGNNSVAMANSLAEGNESFAAAASTASGAGAVALSNSTASGNWSVALANGYAVGNASLAAGEGSLANATSAIALGANAYANVTGSIALGTNITTQVWNSVAVGHYNANISGNTSTWVATDPAFIVGTGNSTTSANGLVVLNNGNTSISGNATIVGNATIGGNTTNATISGNVTLATPQGDIPMGQFGY
jgi:hypothetical protein